MIDRQMMAEIFERIATTDLGYEQIMDERFAAGLPTVSTRTIYRWLEEDEELRQQSARAKDEQADLLFYRAQRQASDPLVGTTTRTEVGKDGEKTVTTVADNVERSKLMVQTTLRRAGQLNPKKYGEKIEHTGELGIKTIILAPTTKDDSQRPALKPAFDDERN